MNLTIDHLPGIKAFCEERIKVLRGYSMESTNMNPYRIDELEMIITLCDGLKAQDEILQNALKPK